MPDSPRAPRSKLRVLLFLAFLLLGAVLAAEAAVRARAHLKYGQFLEIGDLFTNAKGVSLPIGKPNLNVHFAKQSWVTTDSHGFRSPELEMPKPPGRVRLAFLGGSTTFNSFASSNAAMWSAKVVDGLRERYPDVEFDFVNAGVTGYRVAQSRLALEHRVKALDPDVIVIYHATNDIAEDSYRLAQAAGLVPEKQPVPFLERYSVLWRLVQKNLRYADSQDAGLDATRKLDFDPATTSPGFRERLNGLVQEAKQVADLVVQITFTTKFRAEQSREVQLENLQQSFTFMPYLSPEATLAAYDEYNRAIEAVAQDQGSLLVDERYSIPGDSEHFADSVHFTDLGLELQAKRVLRALEQSAAFLVVLKSIQDRD